MTIEMQDGRTHSDKCWRWHADCALRRAAELCEYRARLQKLRALMMGRECANERRWEAEKCAREIRALLDSLEQEPERKGEKGGADQ